MQTPCAIVFVVVAGLAAAAEPVQQLHFPEVGFTIAPLEVPGHKGPLLLSMSLPAEDGFAANVNVQIQSFPGAIEEFATLSSKQFDAAGLEVKSAKTEKGEWSCEYAGRLGERKLHFYARAVKQKDRVFLVTATAAEAQWNSVSAQLKACVDSFTLD